MHGLLASFFLMFLAGDTMRVSVLSVLFPVAPAHITVQNKY